MVTEYMQGGDLASALLADKHRQLGWYEKGGAIMAGAAAGLAYLHAVKVRCLVVSCTHLEENIAFSTCHAVHLIQEEPDLMLYMMHSGDQF